MKNVRYIFLVVLTVLLGSCGDEAWEEIGDPVFFVSLPESVPSIAYPNKEINFPVDVFATRGLEKVEVRVDFQTVDGSVVDSFEDPNQTHYDFSFTPTDLDLGKRLEFSIVAYDQMGFTYDVTYRVEVVLEPVVMAFTLPDDLPDTLEIGDVLDFDIQITSEDELVRLETIYNGSSLADLEVESFENPYATTYHFMYELKESDAGKDATFTFKATDIEGKFKEVSYTLFVEGPRIPLPVDSYESVVLGMQSNTSIGPFIDLESGTVYAVPDAKTNSGTVDLGVFRSGSSGINAFAPSYENAATFIYNAANWGDNNLATWTVRNDTEIRRISGDLMTVEEFQSMENDERILEVFEVSAPSVNAITQAVAGEIIGFRTVDGKHGLMLITSTVSASTGSITFDYRIQQ